MNLSPAYLNFMTETVGLVLTKGLLMHIGTSDNNALILIALYMGRDPQAHEEMLIRLQEKGNLVVEIWRRFFAMVSRHNAAGIKTAEIDVQELMRRVVNGTNGD